VEGSPLLLCDTCPRSYHQACLALADVELPSGDWCCPKCRDSSAAAMRRVMDAESRRAAANERAAARERAAEDKARRAAAARDERKRVRAARRSGGGGGGGCARGGSAQRMVPRGPPTACRSCLPQVVCLPCCHEPCGLAPPLSPFQPDDWEVLEEEKENVQRLEIRRAAAAPTSAWRACLARSQCSMPPHYLHTCQGPRCCRRATRLCDLGHPPPPLGTPSG
jgi:hypothetical protein